MLAKLTSQERWGLAVVCFLIAIAVHYVGVSTTAHQISWSEGVVFYGVFFLNGICLIKWPRLAFCLVVTQCLVLVFGMLWQLSQNEMQIFRVGIGLLVSYMFQIFVQTHKSDLLQG